MKLIALSLSLVMLPLFAHAENAEYSIEMGIAGLDGGIGNRNLRFTLEIPSDSQEAADAVWYLHLSKLLGGDAETLEQGVRALNLPGR